MEDLDGVEADGELAGERHKDEEHVQQQEGAAVLTHHHLEVENLKIGLQMDHPKCLNSLTLSSPSFHETVRSVSLWKSMMARSSLSELESAERKRSITFRAFFSSV